MGFVDIASDFFVELLKGLANTEEPQRYTVADGVPADATFERFEVREGGNTLRVWFSSDQLYGREQFTPRLTVAR